VLGRKVYEALASYWPTATDDTGFAERTNSLPKYVASRTLEGPLDWNASLITGDLAESVANLKRQHRGNLISFGCGELAYELVKRRERSDRFLLAWDHLRDRLSTPDLSQLRFAARNRAWTAVGRSLRALGLEPPPDDGYWRVVDRVGAGSARLARYAACALLAPDRLEPYFAATLIAPWWSVVGDE